MNKEIKLRKRRFWAICFVIVFAMIQSIPSSVLAADYSTDGLKLTQDTTVLYPGDVINYRYNPYHADESIIYYCDGDANKTLIGSESFSNHNSFDTLEKSFIVKKYSQTNGTALSAEEFKGWKVDTIDTSSGSLKSIRLVAVGYTKSTINYVLDGGTNAELNPNFYYEKKAEVVLADPEKEGYTFEGWYSDAGFTTRVTSIPITQTGSITLYAKFVEDEGLPTTEVISTTEEETTEEETTVEKTTEEKTTEEKTTVEKTTVEKTTEEKTTEEKTTVEKTRVEENTTNNSGNELDDTTSSDTTSNSEQPKTGDSSKWFLWAVLLLVSSCGMIGTAVYGKKKKMN